MRSVGLLMDRHGYRVDVLVPVESIPDRGCSVQTAAEFMVDTVVVHGIGVLSMDGLVIHVIGAALLR